MHKIRFKIFFVIILIAFFVLFCRLFYIQIIEGGKYSGISDKKRIRTVSIDTLRGNIFDRNGLTLAVDRHSFGLKVLYKRIFNTNMCFEHNILPELSKVKNKKITRNLCNECHFDDALWVKRVAELLEISYADIFEKTAQLVKKIEKLKLSVERINKKKIRVREEAIPHTIASGIAWRKIAKIEVEIPDLQGIQVDTKPVRWYPQNDLAAHLIGYVSKLDEKELNNYNFKKRWF